MYIVALQECCNKTGLLLVSKCKNENNAMLGCMGRWLNDEQFKAECTNEYLKERTEYRLTGISKKHKLIRTDEKEKL